MNNNNINCGVIYDPGEWRITQNGEIYRKGKIKYTNGDIYNGEFLNHKRNGKGIFQYHNGNIYNGEFNNNLYHGYGILITSDKQNPLTKKWKRGEKYEGC